MNAGRGDQIATKFDEMQRMLEEKRQELLAQVDRVKDVKEGRLKSTMKIADEKILEVIDCSSLQCPPIGTSIRIAQSPSVPHPPDDEIEGGTHDCSALFAKSSSSTVAGLD